MIRYKNEFLWSQQHSNKFYSCFKSNNVGQKSEMIKAHINQFGSCTRKYKALAYGPPKPSMCFKDRELYVLLYSIKLVTMAILNKIVNLTFIQLQLCLFKIADINLTSEAKVKLEPGITVPFTYQVSHVKNITSIYRSVLHHCLSDV